MNDIIKLLKSHIPNKDTVYKNKRDEKFANEIKAVSSQIACVDMWFEMEEDADLMESCIYQRESLQAKYRYLIKKAKQSEACCSSSL